MSIQQRFHQRTVELNPSECLPQVQKCTEELNKRIFEHDVAAEQGFDRPSITLQVACYILPSSDEQPLFDLARDRKKIGTDFVCLPDYCFSK